MSDNFYAIRSAEGTAVIETDTGCVQVFETWEQAVSAPKRKTDEVVAVTIKRVGNSEIESLHTQLAKANEQLQSVCNHNATQQPEITRLRAELAKANERVKELEERCASHEKDMLRQCVFMEKTAEKLEQHREWQATASVLRRPTREAKQALNKFAIEKKIEALKEQLKRKSFKSVHDLIEIVIDSYENQLRKEQGGE